jgi:tetratricopeptide (TPR) repeat protein
MELILNNGTIPESNSQPTLCLNMIVKNESKIITRLLDSVISIIDCYCICDTGSTDNTKEIITEYFEGKNISGKVVTEPFKNFCHNRTFALQSCLGMSDYVLLIDADMVLEIKDFNKSLLSNAASFSILQGNDSFYYENMRIVKNNGLYKYVGVTHEYIDTPPNNTVYNFKKEQIFIRDLGDGGSKHDKFERDIGLLLNGIKEEPNNVRYYFYLANSYHDCGRFGEAINVYKKRIELGGWREEVWYSYYRIGLCFKNMGKINDAIQYWLDGYNYYPERLEGLYEIIHYYRVESKHQLGKMMYDQARKILDLNKNRDSYLFLHNDVYTSKIYYEYTVFAAYVGVTNINYEVVKVLNNSNDGNEVNNMLSNMKFYKDILKPITKLVLDNKITSNINNELTDLTSSSSCLIPNSNGPNVPNGSSDAGYHMNIRYVNYYVTESGGYLNCDKHIISVNKYIEFDKDMNVLCEKWQELKFEDRRYIGVEDVKIFTDIKTNQLLFIGTGFHKNNKIGIVTGDYDIEKCVMNYSELTPNFNNSYCEKNWVFVDYKDETHVVYDWCPLRICKINYNMNELSLVETKPMPKLFSRVRGSSCGFKYSRKIGANNNGNISIDIMEDEIWFVTHIVSYEDPRHYYHLIVVFDANMNLLRHSAPFKFEGDPIEYCLSIVVEDERVLINYSTWDRTTRIGIYDKKYIDMLLEKV